MLSYPIHTCLIFPWKPAQKRLRELKSRISTQSKRNFVLERDVRFLDSRIGLLIQNRMALDEASTFTHYMFPFTPLMHGNSNTKLRNTLKMLMPPRATSQMTARCISTPISSSFSNPSPDTSPPSAASLASPKLIPYSKLSCSPSMETNMKVVRNISSSPCSNPSSLPSSRPPQNSDLFFEPTPPSLA